MSKNKRRRTLVWFLISSVTLTSAVIFGEQMESDLPVYLAFAVAVVYFCYVADKNLTPED